MNLAANPSRSLTSPRTSASHSQSDSCPICSFAAKSFRAHSCKIEGFEVPSNHTLTKRMRAGPGLRFFLLALLGFQMCARSPFIFNHFRHTIFCKSLLLISIRIYPRGGGGMNRLVRSPMPIRRTPVPACKSPLCFQQLTNCLFDKSFCLIFIQTAPGGDGGYYFLRECAQPATSAITLRGESPCA